MVSEKRQRLIYIASDLLTTSIAWLAFNIIRFFDVVDPMNTYASLTSFLAERTVWIGQIIFPALMMGLYYLSGYYNRVYLRSRVEELVSTFSTASIGTIIIYFVAIVDDPIPDRASNYELLLLLFLLLFFFVYTTRLAITQTTNKKLKLGQLSFNALIIGTSHQAVRLKERIAANTRKSIGFHNIVGYVETSECAKTKELDLPIYDISQIKEICKKEKIRHLILAPQKGMHSTIDLVNRLFPLDLPIMLAPSALQVITSKPKIGDIQGEPLIDITHANMSESTKNLKRVSDVVIGFVTLILLLPVYAIIAAMIKWDSNGPIFYRQERIGLRKKPFKIIKFRTMNIDAERNGPALSSENDDRITKVGHILRKYRLDELPQFWNVIKGEMSIVGPRPERHFYIRQIIEKAPYYTLLHQVRPGITSLGMVKYGYAKSIDEMIDRLQYDLLYIENISLTVDFKILIYTIKTVFQGRGV